MPWDFSEDVLPDLPDSASRPRPSFFVPPRTIERQVPRLALTQAEASASIGISLATFKRKVAPAVRCVYLGRTRIYPVDALAEWLAANASDPKDDRRA